MSLTVYNYHYIEMPEYPYSGVHSIKKDDFLNKVKIIKENFNLVSINEIISGEYPENACLITFDDGLKCHFNFLLPIMREYNLNCACFISGRPLAEKRATLVHKSHYVRANLAPEKFERFLYQVIEEENQSDYMNFSDEIAANHYKYDSLANARVKYCLNYVMPPMVSEKIINVGFNQLIDSEQEFCEQWYMSEDEIFEMNNEFNNVGSHAWTHSPLKQLSDKDSKMEIVESKRLLEKIINNDVNAISYPLGNKEAVSDREALFAKSAGYKCGFTMKREINNNLNNPFLISRFDANDLKIAK